jgi:hypothetical protein
MKSTNQAVSVFVMGVLAAFLLLVLFGRKERSAQ